MALQNGPVMTPELYRCACLHAKPFLAGVLDRPYDLNMGLPDLGGVGVYIACKAGMQVDYVGSVCRSSDADGAANRVNEHTTQNMQRRSTWRYIWFVPMHLKAGLVQVRRAEGRIGRLIQPPGTHRLPPAG